MLFTEKNENKTQRIGFPGSITNIYIHENFPLYGTVGNCNFNLIVHAGNEFANLYGDLEREIKSEGFGSDKSHTFLYTLKKLFPYV